MKTEPCDTIRFFHLPELPHVRAVHRSNVANAFPRHTHSGFTLGIVLQGERVISRQRASAIIPANSAFIINPDEAHACSSRGPGHSYFALCVDSESMTEIASHIAGKPQPRPYFRNLATGDARLRSDLRRFFFLLAESGSAMERESLLVSLLSALILRHGEVPLSLCPIGPHADAINRTCGFMNAYYTEGLSLRQLSRVACLSPFYFHRLFLRTRGISPHDYLVQLRIRKARELLSEGMNIADVALTTGFADQSHFCRFFKRHVGTTPGRYLQGRNRDRQLHAGNASA
jgi:AraC-like DNA-binding protein